MRLLWRRKAAEPAAEGAQGAAERWMVVGIGNPGSEYAGNRHNVGAWAVNRLAARLGAEFSHRKLASTAEATSGGGRLLLARPRTYVNESGRAVAELLRRSGIPPGRMIVVYDELELPAGRIRIRARGGHGGHNGLRSIIDATGTGEFPRVRIGIGRPSVLGQPTRDPDHVARYVLANPPPAERSALEAAAVTAGDAVLAIIGEGIEAAMNRFNRGAGVGEGAR